MSTEPTRGGEATMGVEMAREITQTYAPGEHGLTNRLAREFDALLASVQELEREVARLKESLVLYGRHTSPCPLAEMNTDTAARYRARGVEDAECRCGFDAKLA